MPRTLPLLLGFALGTALLAPSAQANQEAKINARIEAWGRNCKNAVLEKHPKATMADISVELGATLQQSINSGETTLKDIQSQGLSFNWSFRNHQGYCNTDGNGNVVELKKL
ncbi:MAG: hypothetical protein VKO39_13490 [Cyanobacteriota bacterium]|nr:hypothetical protein [Cyanobacteriota bacterium]